ncbi:MAG TPA: UbiA family prenyltransferase [Ktedonobacteraceae bacterium]|nr:UbiA family prenyltransferase [Ktedonobacteraceae bacterium]
MDIAKKRRLQDILLGFFLLSHPVPVLLHIIAVTLFTLLAAWQHPVGYVIALVIAAHAAMQLSIAMLNDYCDRRLDAEGKKNKPIPLGLVTPREALVAGLVMIALMLALLFWLPPLALLISLCYLALGQAYNFGLKSTPWSGIVFALAMPLIPLYAFAGVGRVFPFLFWLVPLGFFLGVALNLANSLPDIEKDSAGGAKTLAVYLGVQRSFLACQLLIVLSASLIGLLTVLRIVPANPWIVVAALILTCLSIEARVLFFGPEKPVETRKLYFYLVAVTSLVLAGGWLVGVLM